MVIFDSHITVIENRWSARPTCVRLFHLKEDFEKFLFQVCSSYDQEITIIDNNYVRITKRCPNEDKTIFLNVKERFNISQKEFIQQYEWFKRIIFSGYINIWAGRVEVEDVTKIPKQPNYNLEK